MTTDARSILFVSSYPPRACGIATFTSDLIHHLQREWPNHTSRVAALERPHETHIDPSEVLFHVSEQDPTSYLLLAEKVNQSTDIDLLCIQHEFGLFGGTYGSYVIPFIRAVKKPVVVVMHTVLPRPVPALRNVVRALSSASDRLVAMTDASASVLVRDYGLASSRIDVIPHGIPDVPFVLPEHAKSRFGLSGRFVCTTFGLLGPGKGIEFVLEALPKLVRQHPELVYMIAGATHPVIKREQGEAYRAFLQQRVQALGLSNHVTFLGRFLEQEELLALLQASDVYVSAGLDPNQAVSGTLSYALGVGRPVISTAFAYAKAVLSSKTGRIVPFRNPQAIGSALRELLDDAPGRERMARHAYAHARPMAWPSVARAYRSLFERLIAEPSSTMTKFPIVHLTHLRRMTDSFGMFQFSKGSEPDPAFGYTLDDNARALIAATMLYARNGDPGVLRLARIYLKFLAFAQQADGSFINCVSFDRKILRQEVGNLSVDAQGRALWALGVAAAELSLPEDLRASARSLFLKAIRHADRFLYARSIAFALLGLVPFLTVSPDPLLMQLVQRLAEHLQEAFTLHAEPGWEWFEDELTYGNAKLPEALFRAYTVTGDARFLATAEASLAFLISVTIRDGFFIPVGQDGWYAKGGICALYDQQPIEAGYMVQALQTAFDVTGQERYQELAYGVFAWFLGQNTGHIPLYDDTTGGCYDGLIPSGTNPNQGAESLTCYLMARLALDARASVAQED